MDLSSDVRVLLNAPLAGYDDEFSTLSMKTFDLVSEHIHISTEHHVHTRDILFILEGDSPRGMNIFVFLEGTRGL